MWNSDSDASCFGRLQLPDQRWNLVLDCIHGFPSQPNLLSDHILNEHKSIAPSFLNYHAGLGDSHLLSLLRQYCSSRNLHGHDDLPDTVRHWHRYFLRFWCNSGGSMCPSHSHNWYKYYIELSHIYIPYWSDCWCLSLWWSKGIFVDIVCQLPQWLHFYYRE